MKKIGIVVVMLFAFTLLAVAANTGSQTQGTPGANFEQRKEMMLKKIDERIARLQEEKACIQAATKPEDIRACREKFKPEKRDNSNENRPGEF